jgi:peptide-methionine (R)-S-oxide reductase
MNKSYPVTHTDAEWRKLLTAEQYYIMREHGTEMHGLAELRRAGRRQRRNRGR